MADRFTYATGISSQPIDIASAGQRVAEAATREKLLDIEQGRRMASESEKSILEATTPERIKDIDRALQDRYQKDFDDHRKEIVDMTSNAGGVLTAPQQMEIRRKREDLISKTIADNSAIQKVIGVQDFLKDTRNRFTHDTDAIAAELDKIQKGIMDGIPQPDARTLIHKHAKEMPMSTYIEGVYGQEIDRMDITSKVEKVGDMWKFTSQEDEDKVNEAIDRYMAKDNELIRRFTDEGGAEDLVKKDAVREEVKGYMIKRKVDWQKGSTSGRGNKYKNVVDYTPSDFEYKGNKYSLVRLPSDISQTDRNFFINNAKNLDTGGTEKLTQDNAKIAGVDVDNGVILLEGKGGMAQRGGEDIFIMDGKEPKKKNGEWDAKTYDKIEKTDHSDLLKGQYTGGRKIEDVKNIQFSKDDDGNVTVSGTLLVDKKGWGTGNKEVPVEVNYNTFVDPKSAAIYEAPLWTNKEAVANMFPKVSIRKKPFETYFDNPQKSKEKDDTIEYKGKTFTIDELKGAGWTDADIAKLKKQ